MKKILHIISSPRREESNSTLLGKSIVEKLQAQHPGSTVVTNNVVDKNYQPLQPVHVTAYKLPDESHTPEQRKALQNSDEAVAQLFDADIVVISIPLYNFNIPAALKGWVDHLVTKPEGQKDC
jgi:FMN-dependent NADH-azoreductase